MVQKQRTELADKKAKITQLKMLQEVQNKPAEDMIKRLQEKLKAFKEEVSFPLEHAVNGLSLSLFDFIFCPQNYRMPHSKLIIDVFLRAVRRLPCVRQLGKRMLTHRPLKLQMKFIRVGIGLVGQVELWMYVQITFLLTLYLIVKNISMYCF